MPAKKAAPQKAPAQSAGTGMGMSTIWKWLYFLGLLVAAVLGAIGQSNQIVSYVLIVVAILLGLFYFDSEDLEHFGLRVLIVIGALYAANQAGMDKMAPVGGYVAGFFGGLIGFLAPIVLTMVLVWLWKHRVATLFSS